MSGLRASRTVQDHDIAHRDWRKDSGIEHCAFGLADRGRYRIADLASSRGTTPNAGRSFYSSSAGYPIGYFIECRKLHCNHILHFSVISSLPPTVASPVDRAEVDCNTTFDVAAPTGFSIRGPMGVTSEPTAIHWIGDKLFVEATNSTTSPVWVFSTDGTPHGPITSSAAANETVLSTLTGSFVVLDSARVAIAERGSRR